MKLRSWVLQFMLIVMVSSLMAPVVRAWEDAGPQPSPEAAVSQHTEAAPEAYPWWPGPDGYGYTGSWVTYSWIDVTMGTAIPLSGDDSAAGPYSIGFPFWFYGVYAGEFTASTNGLLTLSSAYPWSDNRCLPTSYAPDFIIALVWDDLTFVGGGSAYFKSYSTCPVGMGRCTVIEYLNVPYVSGGGTVTAEAILYQSGEIRMQFQKVDQHGSGSTSGIQGYVSASPEYGLQLTCGSAGSVPDGAAIRFYPPAVEHVAESFGDGLWPPESWSAPYDSGSGGASWTDTDSGGRGNLTGGMSLFAIVDDDYAGAGAATQAALITPRIAFDADVSVNLSFQTDLYLKGSDTADVDISTDGGATWTNLRHWTSSRRGPRREDIDLTLVAAGQSDVRVRFLYDDHGTLGGWWELDDVFVIYNFPPEIAVYGSPLSQDLCYNATAQQTLDICNTSAGYIYWSLTEDPAMAWLETTPTSGEAPAEECNTVSVAFGQTGLAPGSYSGTLKVNSNDLETPVVSLPASLVVKPLTEIQDVSYTVNGGQASFSLTAAGVGLSYLWDLGDGSTSTLEDPVHTYAHGGSYTVTVTVTGVCGSDGETLQMNLCIPVSGAAFTWSPQNLYAGQPVTFTGTASGDMPLTYAWVFGDGGSASGPVVTHTYGGEGTYTVELTVSNACNSVQVQHAVSVISAPVMVDPPALAAEQCPDASSTQALSVGNAGNEALTWRLSEAPALPGPPDVLLLAAGSANDLQTALNGYADLGLVDYYDARTGTPTLAQLQTYDAVVTWSWDAYQDATAIGNVLADYVDSGGKVIDADFAIGTYNNIQGRYRTEGYSAITGSSYYYGDWLCLGSHIEHEILWGVSSVCTNMRLPTASLAAGSTAVAYWSNGLLFAALKDNQTVVSLNAYFGGSGSYVGQMPDVVHNAILWLVRFHVPWLREEPTGGTLAIGAWDTSDVTFDSAGLSPGTYPSTLLVTGQDPDMEPVEVPVTMVVQFPVTAAGFVWGPSQPTAGQAVTFAAMAEGSGPFQYAWEFGDGGTGTGDAVTHTYAAPGDYLVKLTVTNACGSLTVEHTVQVDSGPLPRAEPSPLLAEQCSGTMAGHPFQMCNDGDQPLYWFVIGAPSWLSLSLPYGEVLPGQCQDLTATIDTTALAPGTYSGAVSFGWPPSGFYDLPVELTVQDPAHSAAFSWAPSNQVVGEPITFQGSAQGTEPLTVEWTFGDGGTGLGPVVTHVYAAPGDYTVTMTASNICGVASVQHTVHVYAGAHVEVSPSSLAASLCLGLQSTQSVQVCNAGDLVLDWVVQNGPAWASASPASGSLAAGACEQVQIMMDSSGLPPGTVTEPVRLVDTHPPESFFDISLSLTVNYPVTHADFIWTPPEPDAGEPITFVTMAEGTAPFQFAWQFGDGETGTGPEVTHTYAAQRDYLVSLTVTNDCGSLVVEHTVHVYGGPVPRLEPLPLEMRQCTGTVTGYPVQMCNDGDQPLYWIAQSTPPWLTLIPQQGEAAPGQCQDVTATADATTLAPGAYSGSILFLYPPSGFYEVPLELTVKEPVHDAGFTWTPADPRVGEVVTFEATAQGSGPFAYAWDFGDGTTGTGQTITHTYDVSGGFAPSVTVTDADGDCGSDSVQIPVHIDFGPVLRIEPPSLAAAVCPGATTVQSVLVCNDGDLPLPWSVLSSPTWSSWTPSTGSVLPGQCQAVDSMFDSAGLAPGTYSGTIHGEWDIDSFFDVTVELTIEEPVHDPTFDWTPLEAVAGWPVTFHAAAGGSAPVEYEWDLGDGSGGTGQDVGHTYAAPGDYLVTLTAMNHCGTQTVQQVIHVYLGAQIVADPATVTTWVCPEQEDTQPVQICNTGDLPLDWQMLSGPTWAVAEPASGSLLPGECQEVTIHFYTYPLEPGHYAAPLRLGDPGPPQSFFDILLDLTIKGPPTDADFGWDPLTPAPGETITFSGWAEGSEPLQFVWNWDDGSPADWGPVVTHTYALPGTYSVLMLAFTDCGSYAVFHDVTVATGDIVVSGPPLYMGLCPDTPGELTLQICNQGNGALDWWLTEDPDMPWLSQSPESGTLDPGICVDVTAAFGQPGLPPGIDTGTLNVNSTDPDTPVILLPAKLTIQRPTTIVDVSYVVSGWQVAFDVTATGSGQLRYQWAFGDDSTSTEEDPVHVYAAGGCYSVRVRVTGRCGFDLRDFELCLCIPLSSADFGWSPADPDVGEEVIFTGTAQGSEPLEYAWDLGDGNTASGQVVAHAYAAPGEYLVAMTVSNECSQMTAYQTVTYGQPAIVVSPASLSAEQCADTQTSQTLQVCNEGAMPLAWSLREQEVLWEQPAPQSFLYGQYTDYWAAEGYGVYLADDFQNGEGWEIDKIWTLGWPANGSLADAIALHWCIYPDAGGMPAGQPFAGGELWCWSTPPDNPAVTHGGGPMGGDVEVDLVAALGAPVAVPPEHWWLVSFAEWADTSTGAWWWMMAETTNLANLHWIDPTDHFGQGAMVWTPAGNLGWSNTDLSYRLDGRRPGAGIPWLGESTASGALDPGACQDIVVTFDSAGLAVGSYAGELILDSDDPDTPHVRVPVALSVPDPVTGAAFSWSPAGPLPGEQVTFSGSAQGSGTLTYEWDFGDGGTGLGSVATHTYAAPGSYPVTLMVTGGCGQASAQHTVVVGLPDLTVSPTSLSAEQPPDAVTTQALHLCSVGDAPVGWSLGEAAGKVSILPPATRSFQVVEGGDPTDLTTDFGGSSASTPPRNPDAVLWEQPTPHIEGGTSALYTADGWSAYSADDFENAVPWSIESIWIPTVYYVGGVYDAAALHWCIYPDAGGAPAGHPLVGGEYWCFSAAPTHPAVTIGGTEGIEVTLDVEMGQGTALILPPGHWWLVYYPELDTFSATVTFWFFSSTANGHQAQFIDPMDHYGGGWTSWTPWREVTRPDWPWDIAFRLEGEIGGDMLSWLSEDPASGTLLPGECLDVLITFDSTGLAPGDYSGDLLVSSNDPVEPLVQVPVVMAVLGPPQDVDFTWAPASPVAADPVSFSATAEGTEPLTYAWDFGDGGAGEGAVATHTFDAPGDYLVTLTVSNMYGQQAVQHVVTVAPPSEMHVRWIRMNFRDRGGGRYAVLGQVRIVDVAGTPVSGTEVHAEWTAPDGTTTAQQRLANLNGVAAFKASTRQTGTWQLCVTDVVLPGWVYDPAANLETCDTITIPIR